MNKIRNLSLWGALSLLAAAGCNSGGSSNEAPEVSPAGNPAPAGTSKMTIAVIPKGTTHVYWKSVEAGARKAAEEAGVLMVFKGPLKENDRAQQISIVEQYVSSGTSAIVLAPLDDTALLKPVQSATKAKIPVVIIDSALKGTVGKDFVSYVSTNNRKGGEMAGEQLAKLLDGKGKVVLLRYQEGSASTAEREAGFLSIMKKNPGITVTVDNRYAGATAGEAKDAALNLSDKLKAADGVFAPNESSAQSMMLALRQLKLAGKIKFVGFDASPALLEGLEKDDISALVVQNPTKMGYIGVKTAVAAAKGQTVPTNVDTGVGLVTKANMNSPQTKELLNQN